MMGKLAMSIGSLLHLITSLIYIIYLLIKFIYLVFLDPFVQCLTSKLFTRRNNKDFADDIVLISGGAQGLGKAIALKFAECGSVVVLWDINEHKLRDTCTEMISRGYEVFAYVVDCSNKDDVYRAAERVTNEVGNVSVLVNNAGIVRTEMIWELEDEQVLKLVNTNFLSHYWMLKAFLPWMMHSNYGTVISISSICGYYGFPLVSHYSASKAAVISVCESLTAELIAAKKTGINVTCVIPGSVDTGLLRDSKMDAKTRDLAQWGKLCPHYVAKEIVNAAANHTSVLVIPWFNYTIPYLKTFLPQRALKFLVKEAVTAFNNK